MKIKDIMHSKPFTVHRNASVDQAARLMWENDLGALPVIDDNDHVIGMITDRDIAMAAFTQGRALTDITVDSSMSKSLYCCELGDELEKAQDLMRQHQVRRIPVLDNSNHLVGLLSLNDIALAYSGRSKKDVKAESVADTLSAISRHRPQLSIAQQHVA